MNNPYRLLALSALATAVAFTAGTAITRADPPGYLFRDIDNNHALVVQPPRDQALARIFKEPTKLPDEVASAIVEGATPLDDSGIILAYHGRLYILPDKDLGAGTMASHTVMKHASAAAN
jgi:hypothetical protein